MGHAPGRPRGVARPEDAYDATPFLPERRSLKALREAAAGCRGCPLHFGTTQTVFGEGLVKARVLMVGEQPGDREDRLGHPFVGPAGRELDHALERVGIPRGDVYITNVVKHFKFEERGKRRIHLTPKKADVDACLPWLRAEMDLLDPQALVLLGATAAKALLGSSFRLTQHRGEALELAHAARGASLLEALALLSGRERPSAEQTARSAAEVIRVLVAEGFVAEAEADGAIEALANAGLIESAVWEAVIAEAEDAAEE